MDTKTIENEKYDNMMQEFNDLISKMRKDYENIDHALKIQRELHND